MQTFTFECEYQLDDEVVELERAVRAERLEYDYDDLAAVWVKQFDVRIRQNAKHA